MEQSPSEAIAAFDFDGCLANTPLGGGPDDWKMQFANVPTELARLHAEGKRIVVVTNESIDRLKKPEAISKCIRKKVGRLEGFARAAGVPLIVLCATAKDGFRKPETGTWAHLVRELNAGVAPNLARSFYVGDAAGRQSDHSDSDLKYAQAVGLTFYTESEFFKTK